MLRIFNSQTKNLNNSNGNIFSNNIHVNNDKNKQDT